MMRKLRLLVTLQSSLESEIGILKKGVDNLQNKLRVGLEIESHLKKKFKELQKSKSLSEEKMRKQMSALISFYSQYKISITNFLDEWRTELKSIRDMVVEKVREIELSGEQNLKSSPIQDVKLSGSECRDVHINTDTNRISSPKILHPDLQIPYASGTGDTSKALAQALQEKVEALLLLSQQDERHLPESNVDAALQKKIEELQRNLLQDQYWAPPNFKRILSAKLKHLAATGKFVKMKRKYWIAAISTLSERRNPAATAPEGRRKISPKIDRDDISNFSKSHIDLELVGRYE